MKINPFQHITTEKLAAALIALSAVSATHLPLGGHTTLDRRRRAEIINERVVC